MVVFYTISLCLLAHISVWGPTAEAFILTDRQSRSHVNKLSRFPPSVVLMSESDESGQDNQEGEEEPIVQATVKIDDGGSNLTNRFKYKVNALMGVFDPQDGDDDERQEGNILNAILDFPVRYTFNIVGRTSGSDAVRDEYVEEIKKVVLETSGDDAIQCQIIPRGKNFTKVQCEVEVQNASMISTIYDDLDKLGNTVMRF